MKEEQEKIKQMKRKGKKGDKGSDYETKSKHTKTEWVLHSGDWRDIVIMYVPQLSDIPIEDNYADISLEEIKDTYIKYGKQRKPHKKRVK